MIVLVATHALLALVVWLLSRRTVDRKRSGSELAIHKQLSYRWGKAEDDHQKRKKTKKTKKKLRKTETTEVLHLQ
jgi:hypothetical protein